MQEIIPLTKRT